METKKIDEERYNDGNCEKCNHFDKECKELNMFEIVGYKEDYSMCMNFKKKYG